MLSAVLRGSKVRELVNDGLEPVTEEMITLASPLDKDMLPLSQVISMVISVSVASLMEMLEVGVRGLSYTTSKKRTRGNSDYHIRSRDCKEKKI